MDLAINFAQPSAPQLKRLAELTTARVYQRADAATLVGFFLGRSSEHLYLAQPLGIPPEGGRTVVLVPLDHVRSVVINAPVEAS